MDSKAHARSKHKMSSKNSRGRGRGKGKGSATVTTVKEKRIAPQQFPAALEDVDNIESDAGGGSLDLSALISRGGATPEVHVEPIDSSLDVQSLAENLLYLPSTVRLAVEQQDLPKFPQRWREPIKERHNVHTDAVAETVHEDMTTDQDQVYLDTLMSEPAPPIHDPQRPLIPASGTAAVVSSGQPEEDEEDLEAWLDDVI